MFRIRHRAAGGSDCVCSVSTAITVDIPNLSLPSVRVQVSRWRCQTIFQSFYPQKGNNLAGTGGWRHQMPRGLTFTEPLHSVILPVVLYSQSRFANEVISCRRLLCGVRREDIYHNQNQRLLNAAR